MPNSFSARLISSASSKPVEDIQFCGIPCRYDQAGTLEPRSWVMVTAKITAEKHPLYKGEVGPVLTALEVTKNAQPADPDVATF